MPYIKPEYRPKLDELIKPLADHLAALPTEKQDGALNYTITKLLKALYKKNYFDLNRSLGALNAVAHEWYRREIAPYEDEKIQENGDV